METDLLLLLASSVLITVPWILSPGPVLAVTIAKGYRSKMAGALIALGHGTIEFPLIFMFYFGLSEFLDNPVIHKVISLIGGFIMIYLGLQTFRAKGVENNEQSKYVNQSSFVAGLVTTGMNPFFFITWVGIGSTLVHNLAFFGIVAVLVFAITHWSCDLLWSTFVSVTVFKSRRFWTPKVFKVVFILCFAILVFFGLWFIVSAFL
ncbi:MAG: LysE family transporter [Nitrososphaerota archaeon]|nr:LysE family translocator [Candidatus Bathyarchaeota archaeon]MDW8022643.1 LysE family transporter [Nitrososphaerota archaeon]